MMLRGVDYVRHPIGGGGKVWLNFLLFFFKKIFLKIFVRPRIVKARRLGIGNREMFFPERRFKRGGKLE